MYTVELFRYFSLISWDLIYMASLLLYMYNESTLNCVILIIRTNNFSANNIWQKITRKSYMESSNPKIFTIIDTDLKLGWLPLQIPLRDFLLCWIIHERRKHDSFYDILLTLKIQLGTTKLVQSFSKNNKTTTARRFLSKTEKERKY